METCHQAHPQIIEAFPRWNYQPDVWQNWYGHAPIASPPACFVQNTILFGVNRHYKAFKQRWKNPTFVSQGACRLMFPGMYPVALGPDCAAGLVLARRSWLVTVWLTHSAVMWGHLYGSIRCALAATCGNCSALRGAEVSRRKQPRLAQSDKIKKSRQNKVDWTHLQQQCGPMMSLDPIITYVQEFLSALHQIGLNFFFLKIFCLL